MMTEKIVLWEKEEYQYEAGFGFVPFLMSYIHEENEEDRPCMIVVPGGGYCVVSPTEGEIVAKKFYDKGYNAFVCVYSTNLLMSTPLRKQPMQDLARAIRYVRKNAAKLHVNPNKLVICGFSAGGHLCGSICVHYEDITDENEVYQGISNRPDAAILSYPVITSGINAHKDSFISLLGADAENEELEYMSLENHVTTNTPPCFIWQTATDELVPVENSFLFAKACKNAENPFAYHVFSHGQHGLSLANEDWASGKFGEPYTMEQTMSIIAYFQANNIPVPEQLKGLIQMTSASNMEEVSEESKAALDAMKANDEVAFWPELADTWLQKILDK